jgi:hypothetical protein
MDFVIPADALTEDFRSSVAGRLQMAKGSQRMFEADVILTTHLEVIV